MKFRPIEDYIVAKLTLKSSSIVLPSDIQKDTQPLREILKSEIYAIGPLVKQFKVGDSVILLPTVNKRHIPLAQLGIEEENKDVIYVFGYEKEVVGVIEEEDVTESPTKEQDYD